MKTERRLLGDFGEKAAARYLKKQRLRILARNYICGRHEIDLIAENAEFLVFAEVKTRTYNEASMDRFGGAASAVNYKKQQNIVAAAKNYLLNYKKQRRVRFDVIEVYVSPENPKKIHGIHHMADAFRP